MVRISNAREKALLRLAPSDAERERPRRGSTITAVLAALAALSCGGDTSDATIGRFAAGEPCTEPEDCRSGLCFGKTIGICADPCERDDDCVERGRCVAVDGGADDAEICVSRDDIAGTPCTDNAACHDGATCVALAEDRKSVV